MANKDLEGDTALHLFSPLKYYEDVQLWRDEMSELC